ncbi:MAG: DinB family protein [Saprospiraceae bacterium]|nr:DinB family protein [Saprospiraceae bacterium]
MSRPKPEETVAYFHRYIDLVENGNIVEILAKNHTETQAIIKNITDEKAEYRYAEGKWSVKEVYLHLMDVERIMAYRALRFARNDKTDLKGFDDDAYVENANAANRTLADIAEEFQAVRNATIAMVKHFTPEILDRTGTANGGNASVRGLVYIIAGHELHHRNILNQRYF